MMTENVRIMVRDSRDLRTLAVLDNLAVDGIHYTNDELDRFVEGSASMLTLEVIKNQDGVKHLVSGNKLAFIWKGNEYWLTIVETDEKETVKKVTALSLSLELTNEKAGVFHSNGELSIAEYIRHFDPEETLTIGINEVSDKRLSYEWTSAQNVLGRLYSLAEIFGAEIEFVTKLNEDYSLQRLILNIYREHVNGYGGMGKNKTNVTLRFGKEITTIQKKENIREIFTAIRATGKNGLTLHGYNRTEYDVYGNVEYFTEGDLIRAPLARDRFPSNPNQSNDKYIIYEWSTQYETQEDLYYGMLAELKKLSVPKLDYSVDGNFDTNPGDTLTLEDNQYKPLLIITARVTEQVESFTEPTKNKTKFSNFREIGSQISADLLQKMQNMINENKTFDCQILASKGTILKSTEAQTTLTARIFDGMKDVTSIYRVKWTKDGKAYSEEKSITVKGSELNDRALYRYEVTDTNGDSKGTAELTVVTVKQGNVNHLSETPPDIDKDEVSVGDKWTKPADEESGEKESYWDGNNWVNQYDQDAFDSVKSAAALAKKVGEEAALAADNAQKEVQKAVAEANEAVSVLDKVTTSVTELAKKADQTAITVDEQTGKIAGLAKLTDEQEIKLSSLEQTTDGFKTVVAKVQKEIDDLDVAGRNLALNTAKMDDPTNYERSGAQLYSEETFQGNAVYFVEGDWSNFKIRTDKLLERKILVSKQDYTFSQWIKVVGTGDKLIDLCFFSDKTNIGSRLVRSIKEDNSWVRLSVTFSYEDISQLSTEYNYNELIRFEAGNLGGTGGKLLFSSIKFEKGSKVTDWTPAPEDLATSSQVSQLADDINLRVKKGEVINQINLSQEGVLISGEKVHITGQTSIDAGIIGSAQIKDASITDAKIKSISADKIQAENLTIVDGKFQKLEGVEIVNRFKGSRFEDNLVDGSTSLRNSAIIMNGEMQSVGLNGEILNYPKRHYGMYFSPKGISGSTGAYGSYSYNSSYELSYTHLSLYRAGYGYGELSIDDLIMRKRRADLPYGIGGWYVRYGKMVFLEVWYQIVNFGGVAEYGLAIERIPEGFRPVTNSSMIIKRNSGTNWQQDLLLYFLPNSEIRFTCTQTGHMAMTGSASWITNDALPLS